MLIFLGGSKRICCVVVRMFDKGLVGRSMMNNVCDGDFKIVERRSKIMDRSDDLLKGL